MGEGTVERAAGGDGEGAASRAGQAAVGEVSGGGAAGRGGEATAGNSVNSAGGGGEKFAAGKVFGTKILGKISRGEDNKDRETVEALTVTTPHIYETTSRKLDSSTQILGSIKSR